MTKEKLEVYICNVCGNIVEVLHAGGGELSCCDEPMERLREKTENEGKEKHVPVIEKTEEKVIVKVGSVAHPMEDAHFIQWIDVITASYVLRKFLKPGDEPNATFDKDTDVIKAREHCSIHGLWSSK